MADTAMLPVDVAQRGRSEMGAAWERCEAACKPTDRLRLSRVNGRLRATYMARWWRGETILDLEEERGTGLTPTDALTALAEALESRRADDR